MKGPAAYMDKKTDGDSVNGRQGSMMEDGPSTGLEGSGKSGQRRNYSVLVARLAIITLFAVSVSLLTIFTWFWTSQSTKNAVNSLGSSLRHDILNRSAGHMLRVLSDQAAALHVTEEASYYQYQLTGDVLGKEMRRQVWGVISNKNYALACSTHTPLARFSYLNPNNTGGRTYKEIFSNTSYPPGQNPISYAVKLDSNGDRVGPATVFGVSVDFRNRDYFLNSPLQPLGGFYWSALYTAQSFPVMTASVALRSNVTGELLGVTVVSQELGAVSHYMSAWDLRGGTLFFKTSDNFLLATSGPIEDFLYNNQLGGRLRLANESTSPVIRAADAYVTEAWGMQRMLSGPQEASGIRLTRDEYYIESLPLSIDNLQVVAIIAIPRASIMGAIDARSRATVIFLVVLSTAIFMLGCILVFCFTTRVSSEVKLKAELEAAKARAEAHSQAKSMFLSNVSHELRTPMAGIMGLLDLLLADELLPEQAVNVAQIRQCATSLLGLLNNLLDLGKIEAGRLELESADFDLTGELESMVDMFAVQCSSKGIEIGLDLSRDMDRVVRGDQARLRQIVANLLSNAVKFSSSGGHVVVRAWPTPSSDTSVAPASSADAAKSPGENTRHFLPFSPSVKSPPAPVVPKRRYTFEVEDTGIGIPPEKREKVFENFVQADSSTTRTHGGTGLGLGIVRSLVRMMGGDIRVVDKEGPGTLMQFEVCFEEPQDKFRTPKDGVVGQGGHVLLAMSGELGRGIAERHLREQGYNVQLLHKKEDVLLEVRKLIASTSQTASTSALPRPLERSSSGPGVEANPAGQALERGRSLGHVAVDIDGVGADMIKADGAPPVLVILDASIFGAFAELEECMRQLDALQNQATVAWLVSSETPGPIRQLLKASYLVANKPLYASRLAELLLAMTSKAASKRTFVQTLDKQQEGWHSSSNTNTMLTLEIDNGLALDEAKSVTRLRGGRAAESAADHLGHLASGVMSAPIRASRNESQEGTSLLPSALAFEGANALSASSSSLLSSLSTASTLATALEVGTTIDSPSSRETSRQTTPTGSQALALAGLRVLVAEDTPILQKLAVKMLSKLGASVDTVDDGLQAANAVATATALYGQESSNVDWTGNEKPYDVVLMDCQMPNMDGYQSTKAIRQAEAASGRYTPIIALTAHAMASDRDKCLAAGMDGYLSKPISQKELVSTLTSIVVQKAGKKLG